jgi:hypothetical protein
VKAEIDELIKRFAGRADRSSALNARLALARDLAEVIDDPETPAYVKVGIARELNKILMQVPYQ